MNRTPPASPNFEAEVKNTAIVQVNERIYIIDKGIERLRDCNHLLKLIHRSLESDKAKDLVTINLDGKTSLADHMIIASGTSSRHVGAMTEHLRRDLRGAGLKQIRVEGDQHCDWVLVDAGDVIVHLFRPEVRDFYRLEYLWDHTFDDASTGSGDTSTYLDGSLTH